MMETQDLAAMTTVKIITHLIFIDFSTNSVIDID